MSMDTNLFFINSARFLSVIGFLLVQLSDAQPNGFGERIRLGASKYL